jgi:hypothetical protein
MKTFAKGTVAHTQSAAPKKMSSKAKVMVTAIAVSMSCTSLPTFAQSISPGYLTGTWKENANCLGNEAMIFFPNNTMSSAGSVPVNYAVTGPSQLTMHGPGGAAFFQAQYVNHNQMVITHQNNASVIYRCGGANPYTVNNAQLTAAYIAGSWTDKGNCAMPEVFYNNGQVRSSLNVMAGWALLGNVLRIMPSTGGNVDFVVQVNGPQNMMLTQTNSGQVSYYARC